MDQAFRGKHYSRILRALQLTYESLQRRIVRIGIDEGLKISDEIKKTLETLRHPLSPLDLQQVNHRWIPDNA